MTKTVAAAIALAAGVGLVAKSQTPEMRRYLKIRRM